MLLAPTLFQQGPWRPAPPYVAQSGRTPPVATAAAGSTRRFGPPPLRSLYLCPYLSLLDSRLSVLAGLVS
jgi:hypothetical protein